MAPDRLAQEKPMTTKAGTTAVREPQAVAGNGLLDRRALLGQGVLYAGAAATGLSAPLTGAAAEPLVDGPWSMRFGAVIASYQTPSRFEAKVVRTVDNP